MKKQLLLLMMILLPMVANAHDIAVENADGVTIYYNYINNGTELEVTFLGINYEANINEYMGKVVIPEEVTYMNRTRKVTSIGKETFRERYNFPSKLTSVTIPNSVKSIGVDAFEGCNSLSSVNISDLTAWCNINFADIDANPLYYAHHLYINGEEIKDLVIPNSVTSIKWGAFYYCTGLTSVTIPNSVTSIGSAAFKWCSGLTSVIIPNSVTSIGGSAFEGCSGLTSITIPNSVTSIGSEAFRRCSDLTSITIPNSVTSIGERAFDGWDIPVVVSLIENPFKIAGIKFDSRTFNKNTFNNATLYVPKGTIDKYKATEGWKDFLFIEEGTGSEISAVEIDGIYYNLIQNERIAEVTSNPNHYTGSVVIPNYVYYGDVKYNVTSIGDEAFYECSGLTAITIPNSVTSIGGSAFYKCSGLSSVTIPNSVTSIYEFTFSGCSGLTSITIGNSVTSIGKSAFAGCFGLTSVTIPNSVTSIGYAAFSWCSGLTSITIPNSVTSIDAVAFNQCSGLTSVTIPNSVTSIGYDAFHGCTGLTSITIGNSVSSIGVQAFYGCTGLTSVTIPNSVTSIGFGAFEGCSGLTSVVIPNSVTSIEKRAFYGADISTVISLIENPFTIYSNTFSDNTFKDATLYVPVGTIDKYKATEGWKDFLFIEEGTGGEISAVEIDGIYYNLIQNERIAEVTSNPNHYTGSVVIPNYVYYGDVKYNVTSIGDEAFYECSGLTSVIIGNSVTSIGLDAFSCCRGLTSVTIGNSVTSIGERAFSDCVRLNKVIVSDIAAWCGIKFGRLSANPLSYAKHLYGDENTEIKDLVIPNNVTSIGDRAFDHCSGLTSVTIPNSVISIGDGAFSYCTGLTSITIPNSVTSIDMYIFQGCSGLTSVTIPNSVTSIGFSVFSKCSGLTSITIPNSVTSIGGHAFSGCSSLTSVTIPNSVTIIENDAFSYCSGLTSITIPNSVTSIGSRAFEHCNLPVVISLINIPFNIYGKANEGNNVFSLNTFENATLYVPVGTIDKYKATEGWKDFAHIVEGEPTGVNVVRNTEGNKAVVYDLNGVRLSESQKGINIINGKKYVKK